MGFDIRYVRNLYVWTVISIEWSEDHVYEFLFRTFKRISLQNLLGWAPEIFIKESV